MTFVTSAGGRSANLSSPPSSLLYICVVVCHWAQRVHIFKYNAFQLNLLQCWWSNYTQMQAPGTITDGGPCVSLILFINLFIFSKLIILLLSAAVLEKQPRNSAVRPRVSPRELDKQSNKQSGAICHLRKRGGIAFSGLMKPQPWHFCCGCCCCRVLYRSDRQSEALQVRVCAGRALSSAVS